MARRRARRRKRYRTGTYTSTKTGRTYDYRSSYERRLMRCLDADDEIDDWDYESIAIYHKQNNVLTNDQLIVSTKKKHRSYTPDFIVTDRTGDVRMIEVKSESNVHSKPTLRKKHLGEQYCSMHKMRYVLWTLHDIIPYEIRMGIEMRDHDAWKDAQGLD